MKLKNSAEDIATLERLWSATERELLYFVQRYREERIVGCRSSDGQEDVCCAAKAKGYPITLVRFLGAKCRDSGPDEAAISKISDWRWKIGLCTDGLRK